MLHEAGLQPALGHLRSLAWVELLEFPGDGVSPVRLMDCFRGSEEPVDLKGSTMDGFERFGVAQAHGALVEEGLVQQTEDQ